jgi:hypothetical protein
MASVFIGPVGADTEIIAQIVSEEAALRLREKLNMR